MSEGVLAPRLGRLPSRFSGASLLGEGSFGQVYRAYDEVRRELVAVKTLHRLSPDSLVRFKREFRSLQDLHHERLVRIHELLEDEGWHLVMEFVDGQSLAEKPVSAADRAQVFSEIVEGLNALHTAGTVHRDLKPANVLRDAAGHVRLVDFGFVASSDADPARGWIGSPAYASPEQLSGKRTGPPSDAYALGVMLYELVEGRLPFQGSAMRIARGKRTTAPPECSHSSASLRALIRGLLSREPEARPPLALVPQILRDLGPPRGELARPAAPIQIVGREDVLQRLHQGLTAARKSGLQTVYLEGESGIGKTTVLQAFASQLDDAVLVQGRCFETETVPFKTLDSAVDDLVTKLCARETCGEDLAHYAARVLPLFPVAGALCEGLVPADSADPRLRRVDAIDSLAELFAFLAQKKPLVLLLDDIQWADDDGLALLHSLCRHKRFPPTLLVLAFRPGGSNHLSLPGVHETLRRLSPENAQRVASQFLESAEKAELAANLSDGDPFLLGELCRASSLPLSLDAFVESLLADLSDAEKLILSVLDLAGAPVPLRVFHQGAWVERTTHTLESMLKKNHLVRASKHSGFLARHARILSGVQNLFSVEERTLQQAELAAAWIQAAPQTLPEHLATTAPLLTRLAERAAEALAFEGAAEFYRRALRVASPERRSELGIRLGECLSAAGREVEAAAAYRDAEVYVNATMAIELRRRVAERLLRAGLVSEGVEALDHVLDEAGIQQTLSPAKTVVSLAIHRAKAALYERGFLAGSQDPQLSRSSSLLLSAGVGLSAISGVRGAELTARSYVYALESGDKAAIRRSRLVDAMYGSGAGDGGARKAHAVFREVEAQASGDAEVRALLNVGRGLVAFHSLKLHECYEHTLAAEEQRDEEGLPRLHREIGTIAFHGTMALSLAGRYREAQVRIDDLTRRADATNDYFMSRHTRSGFLSMATLAVAGADEAARRLRQHQDRALEEFTLLEYCNVLGLVALDLYTGDPFRAYRRIEAMWPRLTRSLLSRSRLVRLSALDLRARCAQMVARSGGPKRTRLVDRTIATLEKDSLKCSRAWALALRASRESDARSGALYRRASAVFASADMQGAAAAAAYGASKDVTALRALGVRDPVRFAAVLTPLHRSR